MNNRKRLATAVARVPAARLLGRDALILLIVAITFAYVIGFAGWFINLSTMGSGSLPHQLVPGNLTCDPSCLSNSTITTTDTFTVTNALILSNATLYNSNVTCSTTFNPSCMPLRVATINSITPQSPNGNFDVLSTDETIVISSSTNGIDLSVNISNHGPCSSFVDDSCIPPRVKSIGGIGALDISLVAGTGITLNTNGIDSITVGASPICSAPSQYDAQCIDISNHGMCSTPVHHTCIPSQPLSSIICDVPFASECLPQAMSLTTLAVSQSTMLGTNTTCMSPLLPSCYDISNQMCMSGPLSQNCLPTDPIFGTITAQRLILANDTIINAQVEDQYTLSVTLLSVNQTLFLDTGATMTCLGGSEISQDCFSLTNKQCPLGPMSDACIPSSMVFYDLTVTNNMTVNQLTCAGDVLSNSCLPIIPIAKGGTNSNAALMGNKLMISTGGAIVEGTLSIGTGLSGSVSAGTFTLSNTGVTSVGLSAPSGVFTVSSSPVTTTGTIALTFTTQVANVVFAGPTTGADATPTFRSLVSDDIPNLSTTKLTSGILPIARGGTNSGTTLLNDRLMLSTGGAIVEGTLSIGTGLSGSVSAGTFTLSNSGVTSIVAGSGISINQATGAVTITATGGGSGLFDPANPVYHGTGTSTSNSGANSVTIGAQANTLGGTAATSVGADTDATGAYSSAFGYGSTASAQGTVSIGPLSVASGLSSIASGDSADATGDYSAAYGPQTTAAGSQSVVFGYQSTCSSSQCMSMGQGANVGNTANRGIAHGRSASATNGVDTTAVGNAAVASNSWSTALGSRPVASGSASTAIGVTPLASGTSSVAIGDDAKSTSTDCLSMGWKATASGQGSIAYGAESISNVANGVVVGTRGTTNGIAGAVVLGFTASPFSTAFSFALSINTASVSAGSSFGITLNGATYRIPIIKALFATTVTAGQNSILDVNSALMQYFTGTSTQTVVLPDAGTLVTGFQFKIVNRSTQTLTVRSAVSGGGANIITTINTMTWAYATCTVASGNSPTSWSIEMGSSVV